MRKLHPGKATPCALVSFLVLLATLAVTMPAIADDYDKETKGTRVLSRGELEIKVLVEAANLGSGEVEVAEITFPGGSQGGDHLHGAIEIIYLLEGKMDHVVNDVSHVLTPGMIGIVKPGDRVSHVILSEEPAKALVVWAPGGEAERIAPAFEQTEVK